MRRAARELDEQILHDIERVRFVAQQIQEKGKQGRGVFIVEPCDVWRCLPSLLS